MGTPYKIGYNYEARFRDKLEKRGFLVIRASKSKGGRKQSKRKPIDLVAMKNGIATNYSLKFGNNPHFDKEEIEELKICKERSGFPVVLVQKQRGKPEKLTSL